MAKNIKRSAGSFVYTLEADRAQPADQQTEFALRPMTVEEYAIAQDDIVRTIVAPDGTRSIINRTRQQGVAIALEHIVSVRNFPVGSPKDWPTDPAQRRAYLSEMVADDVQEIAGAVFCQARLGDEEKNSSLPERTSASGDNSLATASTTARAADSAG
jgi:hypothetical protein